MAGALPTCGSWGSVRSLRTCAHSCLGLGAAALAGWAAEDSNAVGRPAWERAPSGPAGQLAVRGALRPWLEGVSPGCTPRATAWTAGLGACEF